MRIKKCKLFLIYNFFLFVFPCIVLAQQTDISDELSAIKNLQNINIALDELLALERVPDLTISQQADVLNTRANLYLVQNNFEQSLIAYQRLQSFASLHNLKEQEAIAYKFIGVSQYYQGNTQDAITAYQKAAIFFDQDKTPVKHANLLNNIALSYSMKGDTVDALHYYKKAELLYIKSGTLRDQVDIRGNIAEVYMRIERYDIAINMLHEVLAQKMLLEDKGGIATTHSALGVSYKKAGQYDKAIEYLTDALEYYQYTNKTYFVASQLHNLAEVYAVINKPKEAINYSKAALELAKLTDNTNAMVGAWHSYASALFQIDRVDEALVLLEKSQAKAIELKYQQQINENLALLMLIHAYKKDTKKALNYQREYKTEHYKRSNEQINQHLNRFESEQLKEKVKNLENINVLQELKSERDNQQRNLVIIAGLFFLITAIYIYSRIKARSSQTVLANKIKIRTHELESLTEELELANEVKSQFLANMSHEIRTPLTAVIGQSEAILSGDIAETAIQDEVGIIHSNSLHVLDLINSILDLSKIEANKLELDPHHQDLHDLFIELVNIFDDQAKTKGLKFTINHRLPVPFILNIDALRLKQIIINLCSNAIKFTNKGEVTLTISIIEQQLYFKVSDTGIGMSDTQLNEIFNSFTQGDSSISRRFGGSGLGLSLSKQLASLMDGKISVQSELNKGSVFTLSLPCTYAFGVNEHYEMKEVIDNPLPELKDKCTGQVILADDHNDNLRLIARILSSLGLDVLTASNGKEAVELYVNNTPKLILMDIQMPEMDGIEAFNVLKQKGCKLPVIALTANAMSHEVDEYLALGFDGHLKKPIERNVFVNTIVKYCSDSGVSEETKKEAVNVDTSDLVKLFRSNLVLEQQDLILHLNNEDYEKLAVLAHRIAGAGQMFGFSALSEKAIAVEYAIKNNFTNIHDFTQYLLNEIDSVLW